MDYFGTPTEIDELSAGLGALRGTARVEALARLAWSLRQRDTARALQHLDEAQTLPEAEAYRARLLLTHAEIADLHGDVPRAGALCESALAHFTAQGDAAGEGDAHYCEARLCTDRGSAQQHQAALERAVDAYARAGDSVRLAHARMLLAEFVLSSQPEVDFAPWQAHIDEAAELHHPGVDTLLHFVRAVQHDLRSEAGHTIAHFRLSHEACLRSGRLRLAILVGSNLVDLYYELGSLDECVAWGGKTVALARRCGWPVPMAAALVQVGFVWRRIGHRADAADLVAEAARLLQGLPNSRTNAAALFEQGVLHDDPAMALELLDRAEAVARDQRYRHLALQARRARADALSGLGRVAEAVACLDALQHDKQSPVDQVETLRMRAAIAARHPDAPGVGSALQWLAQALRTAQASEARVPTELLAELSTVHEAAGQVREALAFERQAAAARERSRVESAAHLATAVQVLHETERARTEAAQQKALAAAEFARAEAEAQARRAKTTYLAGMSHELRSPLNAILGLTQLLLREPSLQAHRDELEIILRNGGDLHALIERVLRESKTELKPE